MGETLLSIAIIIAWRNSLRQAMDLVTWLVDEKGADINASTHDGYTALFLAKSVQMLSFFLQRGVDPLLHNPDGRTPLMYHSNRYRTDFVARLLQDERVVATIDLQATDNYF